MTVMHKIKIGGSLECSVDVSFTCGLCGATTCACLMLDVLALPSWWLLVAVFCVIAVVVGFEVLVRYSSESHSRSSPRSTGGMLFLANSSLALLLNWPGRVTLC